MADRRTKGLLITAFNRFLRINPWDYNEATAANVDKRINAVDLVKVPTDDAMAALYKGLFNFTDSNLFVFNGANVTIAGSVYTVTSAGYAFYNKEIWKVEAGSATLTTAIIFTEKTYSTADGPYRTLQIANGTAGSGIVDYANAKWANDTLDLNTIKYHTATLTPSGNGSITLDSSYNRIAYVEIGPMVWFTGWLQPSSSSSPTGSYVYISLPHECATDSIGAGTHAKVSIEFHNTSYDFEWRASIFEGESRITLAHDDIGTQVADQILNSNDWVKISGHYFRDLT